MQKIVKKCPNCGANIDLTQYVENELLSGIRAEVNETADLEKVQEPAELQKMFDERPDQLSEAHPLEVDLQQKRMELEEKTENVELEIVRRLDDEGKQLARQGSEAAIEESGLKIKEYEKQLKGLHEDLGAAQRKTNQGSQQLEGEGGEWGLEEFLKYTRMME